MVSFKIEGTGGNCTALVGMDGNQVVVITEADEPFAPSGDPLQVVDISWHAEIDWVASGEYPIKYSRMTYAEAMNLFKN